MEQRHDKQQNDFDQHLPCRPGRWKRLLSDAEHELFHIGKRQRFGGKQKRSLRRHYGAGERQRQKAHSTSSECPMQQ